MNSDAPRPSDPRDATLRLRDVVVDGRKVDIRCEDGRIAAIEQAGSTNATGATLEGGGGTVLPGFVDAHLHLVLGATTLEQVDLARCTGRTDFERRLTARSATLPSQGPDAWLLGHGWLETDWGGELPDRS